MNAQRGGFEGTNSGALDIAYTSVMSRTILETILPLRVESDCVERRYNLPYYIKQATGLHLTKMCCNMFRKQREPYS